MEAFTHRLRPVTPDDAEFLLRLYASTRERELAQVPWSAEQKALFLRQQFDTQASWWLQEYSEATFDVVEIDGRSAGRLYVHRAGREHRIVDIALLPEHCGQGIGTRLIQAVLAEAERAGARVTLHVEVLNPARRLYERLGFVLVEDRGVYLLMERTLAAEVS